MLLTKNSILKRHTVRLCHWVLAGLAYQALLSNIVNLNVFGFAVEMYRYVTMKGSIEKEDAIGGKRILASRAVGHCFRPLC